MVPILMLVCLAAAQGGRTPEAVANAALEVLAQRPAAVVLIDPDRQDKRVAESIRNLDAFTVKGEKTVYLNIRGGTFQRAMTTQVEEIYRFDLHVLAAAIHHEMAHIDGADEREAQREEERLWMTFIRDGRVDQQHGLRQAQIYARRQR